jgi:RNA polymerase sigma factor (sigma-70 family)
MADEQAHISRQVRKLVAAERARQLSDRELLRLYAAQRDEGAFAALVRRHGPMVLRVCLGRLGNWQDAEDACQATFLVLAHQAGSPRWQESVAPWLYRVAYRLAGKARAAAARRSAHECRAGHRAAVDLLADVSARECQEVLDDELVRLPEKYRAPLVLCCLQGNDREEAARRLGWPVGVVKSRLEQGRELLRSRLTRRGLTVPAALLAGGLAPDAGHGAALGRTLGVVRRAMAGPGAGGGVVPARVSALAGGVTGVISWKKRTVAAALLAGLAVAGAGAVAHRSTAPQPARAPGNTRFGRSPDDVLTFPAGPPRMVTEGQKPSPAGGRVILYSRSRHGNYPLATYAFHLGLRGDDRSVGNDVNLIFGNTRRRNAGAGPPVESVPGVWRHGAAGMDGAGLEKDLFRVNCLGGSEHRILDLGTVDYDGLRAPPRGWEPDCDEDAGTAPVEVNHVYVIRLFEPEHPNLGQERYVKLKVLAHRDNDAVLFAGEPLPGGERGKPRRSERGHQQRERNASGGRLMGKWMKAVGTCAGVVAVLVLGTPAALAAPLGVPDGVVKAVEKLVSEDVDTFLSARRQVLAHGPACLPLVADIARKRDVDSDPRLKLRLAGVMADLESQEPAERRLRVSEAGLKRVHELRTARGEGRPSRIDVLVSRQVSGLVKQHPADNLYAGLCYFSFPKNKHGYKGAVSLEFGNSPDCFQVEMYGGQQNRLKDLGAVDFAGVKSVVDGAATAWGRRDLKAVVGHVYIEHCLEPDDKVDMAMKFKVIDLKPGEWVVIEWEPIPQKE